mmetsp:Transcript_17073/g.26406  ORF Transcript_17073/g.26406 Transcript_17073/m.26406 type:complete len:80 (+) Transcript_17073:925-1164(+)
MGYDEKEDQDPQSETELWNLGEITSPTRYPEFGIDTLDDSEEQPLSNQVEGISARDSSAYELIEPIQMRRMPSSQAHSL